MRTTLIIEVLFAFFAVILYMLFVPITIIQATSYILRFLVTGEWLFSENSPLSLKAAQWVMKHCP